MDIETKKRWSMLLKKSIESKRLTSDNNNTILIVDGLNLFIRSFSVVPTVNDNGVHNGGLFGALNSLKSVITKLQPNRCVIIFDGKGGSKKRRKLYPLYKNNRKGMKNLNRTFKWLNESQEEQSCKNQLISFIEYLQFLPITTFAVDNIEADDAIAYLVTHIYNDKKYKKIIMSSDKDYLQLVNDNVYLWSPIKKILYTPIKVEEEYELKPENIIYWRILDGDKSDNIPGVKGWGKKTVLKLFGDFFKESEKTIEKPEFFNYIDYLYNETEKKTTKIKSLFENKDILERNFKLMQLSDVDISGTSKSLIIDNTRNKQIPLLNQTKLKKIFMQDGLYSQIRNFNAWYSSFSLLNSSAKKFNNQLLKK